MGRRPPYNYRAFHVSYVAGKGGGGLGSYPTLAEALGHTLPQGFNHPTYIEEVTQREPLGKLVRNRTHRWHRKRGWVEL